MKKIIILVVMLLSLAGCYDYNEINSLDIVVGIGIDYQDEKFEITYEILSNNKDKEAANVTARTVSGEGSDLASAVDNTTNKMSKKVYYSQTDIILIGKEVAENHLEDIIDYILRSGNIRDNFLLVVTNNAKEILNTESEDYPVISSAIVEAITSDSYSGSYTIEKEFVDVVREIISFGMDTSLPIVYMEENDILIEGIGLFQDYKMVKQLNREDTAMYNVLTNNIKKTTISKDYDEKIVTLAIMESKLDVAVLKDEITISGGVSTKVINNEANFELTDPKTIKDIEKDFKEELEKKLMNVIQKIQSYDTDVLGLANKYYIKTRDKKDNYWQNAKVNIDIEVTIAKKGIIYEVENND